MKTAEGNERKRWMCGDKRNGKNGNNTKQHLNVKYAENHKKNENS